MIHSIHISFKPPAEMRYQTVGDWTITPVTNELNITIALKPNSTPSEQQSAQLVAIHELVEALLSLNAGVTQAQVDDFDLHYKGEFDEPGEDPTAPYHAQHTTADIVERITAQAMSLDWDLHDTIVEDTDKLVGKALRHGRSGK